MELTWWFKTKVFLGKVWSFLKLYGTQVALVAVGIYVYFVLRGKNSALEKLISSQQRAQQAHQENLARLEREVAAELQRRQEIERQYTLVMDKIKKDHAVAINRLAETKTQEIRAIIERNLNNPEAMTAAFTQLFGIPVVNMTELP